MRSFQLLSLFSSVFLFSCRPGQALHANKHENSGARYRHINSSKRDANVAFTYFADGQGACGATNGPNDFIVAIDSAEYNGGTHCFEMITITIGGKTAQAQITDQCTGCGEGGLDFSQSLFEYFGPLSAGKLYGSWSYNSDIPTSSSTPPASTTSDTSTLAPTTTVATTTSLSTTTMTSSASSVPSPTSMTSIVPSSTLQASQVLAQIDLALLELGALLQVSVSVSLQA